MTYLLLNQDEGVILSLADELPVRSDDFYALAGTARARFTRWAIYRQMGRELVLMATEEGLAI